MKELIHLAGSLGFASVWTKCGLGRQHGYTSEGEVWDKNVNCWGKTGTIKTKGWNLLTVDRTLATCLKCLKVRD